jgi:D-beta-D-heptose 7-phosphate kinase/D-beta-D-heptose 1-phosphate adenosyltransferase
MNIVVVSGGFDPIHSGHINLFKHSAVLGDRLIVGINSDAWLSRKKGKAFMQLSERKCIVQSIKWVDEVWEFNDTDDSACDLLDKVKKIYSGQKITFANGGDRNVSNNREIGVQNISFVYGVGGDFKMNSSSTILKKWQELNPNFGV